MTKKEPRVVRYSDLDHERVLVDEEPIRLMITSEPFIVIGRYGYQVAFEVYSKKRNREYVFIAGAASIAEGLENIKAESESSSYSGLEFWVQKASVERSSKYIITS